MATVCLLAGGIGDVGVGGRVLGGDGERPEVRVDGSEVALVEPRRCRLA